MGAGILPHHRRECPSRHGNVDCKTAKYVAVSIEVHGAELGKQKIICHNVKDEHHSYGYSFVDKQT